jgi:hypothetical protein
MTTGTLFASLDCSPPSRTEAEAAERDPVLVWEARAVVVDCAGGHDLVRVQDLVFLCLKAGPTERRYILRVPPTMRTVAQAISWTFGR